MIYEYSCRACGDADEAEFAMGKAPETIQCHCGKRMQRVIAKPKYMLKGEGWAGKNRI